MSDTFKAACVQNRALADMEASIGECDALVRQAHARGADLITLPEFLSYLDMQDKQLALGILPESEHPALAHFRQTAETLGVWILLGSLAIDAGDGKANNRSYLIDATGNVVSRYNKIHMCSSRYKSDPVLAQEVIHPRAAVFGDPGSAKARKSEEDGGAESGSSTCNQTQSVGGRTESASGGRGDGSQWQHGSQVSGTQRASSLLERGSPAPGVRAGGWSTGVAKGGVDESYNGKAACDGTATAP